MIDNNPPSSHILLPYDEIKKFVLSEYNLQNSIIEQIKFKDTDKQRAVYSIISDSKKYCLKKVYYNKNDLLFIYSASEWLYRYNIRVTRILPTRNNSRFVLYNNMLFILMPWIEGKKCDYNNLSDILVSTKNLALMHKFTKNFIPITGSNIRYGLEDIYISTKKHFDQILDFCNIASKINDKFSRILLENSEECIATAKIALKASNKIHSENLKKSLCHLDYVNKNLIFDDNNNLWVIDFDNCKIDFSVHDLSYSLRRILKRDGTNWDNGILINTLNSYESINVLNLDEYLYILSYLAFPQKFWKICKDYYRNIKKCNKSSFINLLKSSVKCKSSQLTFAENFANYINGKFNTYI